MAGVRIVNRQGGTPSTLALLIRNAFRLIDCLPVFYGVGLVRDDLQRPAGAPGRHGGGYPAGP